VQVDVRILAATNKAGRLMARGEFRQDLFYRLNVHPAGDAASP
jgi:transcriptional regulator with GAF, ATPase, and Fis domain